MKHSLPFFSIKSSPPSPFLNLDVFIHHCLSARPPALLSLRWIHQLHWCQSQAALPGTGWLACPPRPLTSFIVYSLHFLSFPARFFDNNHVFWRDQSQCCFSTFRWKTSPRAAAKPANWSVVHAQPLPPSLGLCPHSRNLCDHAVCLLLADIIDKHVWKDNWNVCAFAVYSLEAHAEERNQNYLAVITKKPN